MRCGCPCFVISEWCDFCIHGVPSIENKIMEPRNQCKSQWDNLINTVMHSILLVCMCFCRRFKSILVTCSYAIPLRHKSIYNIKWKWAQKLDKVQCFYWATFCDNDRCDLANSSEQLYCPNSYWWAGCFSVICFRISFIRNVVLIFFICYFLPDLTIILSLPIRRCIHPNEHGLYFQCTRLFHGKHQTGKSV